MKNQNLPKYYNAIWILGGIFFILYLFTLNFKLKEIPVTVSRDPVPKVPEIRENHISFLFRFYHFWSLVYMFFKLLVLTLVGPFRVLFVSLKILLSSIELVAHGAFSLINYLDSNKEYMALTLLNATSSNVS